MTGTTDNSSHQHASQRGGSHNNNINLGQNQTNLYKYNEKRGVNASPIRREFIVPDANIKQGAYSAQPSLSGAPVRMDAVLGAVNNAKNQTK